MTILPAVPSFGHTYDIGWIGFTRTFDAVGDAIAYGERYERAGMLPSVNHALVVIGDGECVQAHIDNGVQRGPLAQYLDDPKSHVFFCQPLKWKLDLGQRIAASGLSKVGDKYDKLLIAEMAAADSLIGHAINKILADRPHEIIDSIIERLTPNQLICSFEAAFALAAQPEFADCPLFQHRPLSSIDPQLLMASGPFEDSAFDLQLPSTSQIHFLLMLFADIDPSTPPAGLSGWLACAFWTMAIIGAGIYIVKSLRGKEPLPGNETLGHAAKDHERRLNDLEHQNIKAWVKMEEDARKIEKMVADLSVAIAEVRAFVDVINQQSFFRRLRNKK